MALFRPTFLAHRVTDVTVNQLKNRGIHTLLLDVDNTLSTHHSQTPLEGVEEWLVALKQGGISLFIVSNARKERVEPFAKRLQLPFFSICQKPLPFRINKAIQTLAVKKSGVLLCGDQLFTDIPAGNLAGISTLLVQPAQRETGWTFKVRRWLEQPLLKRYQRGETI